MRHLIPSALIAAALALALAGCGKGAGTNTAGNAGAHGHSHDHDHEDHGEEHKIGDFDTGGLKGPINQLGDVVAGKEAAFEIDVDGASEVRGWIGGEDRTSARVGKAEKEGEHWHLHADTPNPLPADAKLWIEVTGGDGNKHVASFPLHKD